MKILAALLGYSLIKSYREELAEAELQLELAEKDYWREKVRAEETEEELLETRKKYWLLQQEIANLYRHTRPDVSPAVPFKR